MTQRLLFKFGKLNLLAIISLHIG